jgi:DNA-binding NarL/FixJ family response regulator
VSHTIGRARRRPEKILVVDDRPRFLSAIQRQLDVAGFRDVQLAQDERTTLKLVDAFRPDVLLVDIHLDGSNRDGLELLTAIRSGGFAGVAVVISGDRSPEQFFRAARAGANDFLVKGPHVSVPEEIIRLLDGQRGHLGTSARVEAVSELGYLRSFGLTPKELDVLTEYATDFPRLNELAERIGQATVQLRKVFSRIYKKTGLKNLGQLAHVISVCAMFERDN